MSMSMYVKAIRPGDAKWHQMKAIRDACLQGGVSVPTEVEKFFNYDEPDPKGVVLELGSQYGVKHECCTPYDADMHEGFEIDVSKIPSDVKVIRFYCSW